MKMVKRIIAVLLLIVVVFLVGYVVFTYSQLLTANGLEMTTNIKECATWQSLKK